MDKDLATIMLATAIRTASEIGDLAQLPLPGNDDLKYGIGLSVYDIHEHIISPILRAFPDLKEDLDRRMSLYGRFI